MNLRMIMGPLAVLCIAGIANVAHAADEVQLGEFSYEGSACPPGTLTINPTGSNGTVDFKLQPMTAQAGQLTGRAIDLRDCNVIVPVQVPKGYRVAVAPMQYGGDVYLPFGTMALLYVNYYYEFPYGISQLNYRSVWQGEQIKKFSLNAPRKVTDPLFWSNCGDSFKLKMHLSLQAQSNRFNHNASMTLDHLGGFELKVDRCQ